MYAASQVLEKYEDEFFKVVDATVNLPRLKRKNVVTEKVITRIKGGDSSEAKDYLYEHLKTNATVDTLREYCTMISEANGLPRMQELGKKMLRELPPGVLVCHPVCVCVCVCACVCACACACVCTVRTYMCVWMYTCLVHALIFCHGTLCVPIWVHVCGCSIHSMYAESYIYLKH